MKQKKKKREKEKERKNEHSTHRSPSIVQGFWQISVAPVVHQSLRGLFSPLELLSLFNLINRHWGAACHRSTWAGRGEGKDAQVTLCIVTSGCFHSVVIITFTGHGSDLHGGCTSWREAMHCQLPVHQMNPPNLKVLRVVRCANTGL